MFYRVLRLFFESDVLQIVISIVVFVAIDVIDLIFVWRFRPDEMVRD